MNKQTFKRRLGSTLKDNALERYVSNRKKGKLDFKKLHKISHSMGIFKQKEERRGKDYSITLLLDSSDSMNSGSRATVLAECVAEITPIFESLDIPLAVYSFGQTPFILKDFEDKLDAQKVVKEYWRSFDIYVGKCRGKEDRRTGERARCQNWVTSQNRYFGVCDVCGGDDWRDENSSDGTNDGLALHIAGNNVCKKNKKNILLVITDGEGRVPDEGYFYGVDMSKLHNAKSVLRGLHKQYKDLVVLCVGIGTGNASRVYGGHNTVEINNSGEVFNAIIKMILKNIKRA